jgi:hypothetical protein
MFILIQDTVAIRKAICWARDIEGKMGAGVCMWSTNRLRFNISRVGAATMCKQEEPMDGLPEQPGLCTN